MAIGAYTMAILDRRAGMELLALAARRDRRRDRLRADHRPAVAAAARRLLRDRHDRRRGGDPPRRAQRPRPDQRRRRAIFGFDDSWNSISESIEEFIVDLGWTEVPAQFPLFLVTWGLAIGLIFVFSRMTRTPWGRVLRAVREDEDAARALGKNAFSYKLQSLALAATTGALAGFLLALNLKFVVPDEFQPLVTFTGYAVLILGGLANYWGVALGAIVLWSVLEGLRFLELPLSETKIAALRFIILGLVLIGLMAFRPQGFFGNRKEMVLGD